MKKFTTTGRLLLVTTIAFLAVACEAPESTSGTQTVADKPVVALPDANSPDPVNPPVAAPEIPAVPETPTQPAPLTYVTDILLFNGTGVSVSDWQSTEEIVQSLGLSYQLVNSAQLNAMTLDQIASFGAIVIPGGSGGTIAGNLTAATQLNVRKAVRDRGVGYVGFCAGAWVAVGPEAEGNQQAGYGMAVAKGDVLPYYYPGGNTSLVAAMTPVKFPDGSNRSLVWWGGPSTPEWSKGVIARYSTGEPAISQAWSGKGLVVVSGPHPEAPQGWRLTAGNDPDGLDFDLAIELIQAALTKQPLPTF